VLFVEGWGAVTPQSLLSDAEKIVANAPSVMMHFRNDCLFGTSFSWSKNGL
jgi:hypothetical protein